MNKAKLATCLLAAAALAGATTAFGGNTSTFSMGLGVQYWDTKELDTFDEDGFWGANIIARVMPSDIVGLELRFGGSGVWKDKTYYYNGKKYETDATFTCCPIEAGVVLMLPIDKTFSLYGGAGVGYYIYDIDIKTSSKHGHHYHSEWDRHISVDNDFGWYGVAGLKINLGSPVSLFAEARYTDTETNIKHEEDRKFDCRGVGVQAGVMFDF